MEEQFGYAVDIESFCTHSYRENVEFGSWHESYSNTLRSVKKTERHPDVVSTLDIKNGEIAIVVWAEWSSGDSFGRADRGHAEAFGIFRDIESADSLIAWLEGFQTKEGRDERGLLRIIVQSHTTPDGQVFKQYRLPWGGYFENLDELHATPIIVGRDC